MTVMDSLKSWIGTGATDPGLPAMAAHATTPEDHRGAFNHTAFSTVDSTFYGGEPSDGIEAIQTGAAMHAVESLFSSGWLQGVVDAAIAQIIGDGLRLNVKADLAVLGWTPERGAEFAQTVESLFNLWAENAHEFDYSGRQNFAQFQRAALRSYFGTGEALAIHPTRKSRGGMFASKSQLLDIARLDWSSADHNEAQGIYYSGGRAAGVVVKDRDPASLIDDWDSKKIPFRSRSGKPLASLTFDHVTPQQRRGVTPLLPVLRLIKQLDALTGASLATAQLYTLFAIAITSGATTDEVTQALSNDDSDTTMLANYAINRSAWYKGQGDMLAGSGVAGHPPVTHLLPGESMDLKNIPEGASNLAEFARLLKLEITRALGVPYSLTGDYAGSTYSSTRMETAVNWPLVLHRRRNVIGPLVNDVFQSALEEFVIRGLVQLPGGLEQFYAMRPAFRAEWRGPSMPQADENKSANAAKTRLAIGTTSLAKECAANGDDWQEVLEQRAREKAHAEKLGLPDPHVSDPDSPEATSDDEDRPIQHSGKALTYAEALDARDELQERVNRLTDQKPPAKANAETRAKQQILIDRDRKQLRAEIDQLESEIEAYQS
ncbi:MAG: phage portal protein [Fimbriimonadaceae bacterium]|nr:phage portal protein [Alphaproteobacteria bacterium]